MFKGSCTCKEIQFQFLSRPIVVHCCHCTWCQRESGAAFAINAVIESSRLKIESGKPEVIMTPSLSGKGQKILRCPNCKVAVWSHYPGGGEEISFVRVGTLDNPKQFPPEIHIFTSTKQLWFELPKDCRAFSEFYVPKEEWSADSLARWQAVKG